MPRLRLALVFGVMLAIAAGVGVAAGAIPDATIGRLTVETLKR
jgi:hypothetical protein